MGPSPQVRGQKRRFRFERRGLLWDLSALERVRKCGRVSVMPGGNVAVRLHGDVAGFAGLSSCGSVWADPVCNAKVMARRAIELGAAIALWQQHGEVAFLTFTMRHRRGQSLADLWTALSDAWGRVTSGKGWVLDKRRHGVAGWVRVVEVTIGDNGWHVHVHCLVFLDGKQTDQSVTDLHASMFARWSSRLERLGLRAPLMVGQDAHLVRSAADGDLARYFTKVTDSATRMGLEVTATQGKRARGRHGTRTPWALLDDVQLHGLAGSLGLWHEWERGSKGRKQMTWSLGLRDRLGLLREASDEQIVAEEHGSQDDDLVLIDAGGWRRLTANPGELADLLAITETGGLGSLRFFLDTRKITYTLLGDA